MSDPPIRGLRDITDVRAQKIRRFHIGGADAQLVIATAIGEIGFLLKDPEGWADVVHGQLARARAPDTCRPPATDFSGELEGRA